MPWSINPACESLSRNNRSAIYWVHLTFNYRWLFPDIKPIVHFYGSTQFPESSICRQSTEMFCKGFWCTFPTIILAEFWITIKYFTEGKTNRNSCLQNIICSMNSETKYITVHEVRLLSAIISIYSPLDRLYVCCQMCGAIFETSYHLSVPRTHHLLIQYSHKAVM